MLDFITLPGLIDYQNCIEIMEEHVSKLIRGFEKDKVFLLEHQSLYTAGTSAHDDELLSKYLLPIIHTGRGGKYTYHGPGQRVIYPIINLNHKKDIKLYIHNLEQWIIKSLEVIGIKAYTILGNVGIWTKNKDNIDSKIGAIGIRVRKWVAYHGISINISPDLEYYKGIIPCGISNFPTTSLKEIGINMTMTEFDSVLKSVDLDLK